MENLENLIQDYLKTTEVIIKNQKPFSGIFGFKGGISSDGCHEVFLTKLKDALQDEDIDPYEAVKFLIYADQRYACHRSVKFMLTAIQGLAVPFISMLTDDQRKEFKEYFDNNVPKHLRLPVQDQIYKELKK